MGRGSSRYPLAGLAILLGASVGAASDRAVPPASSPTGENLRSRTGEPPLDRAAEARAKRSAVGILRRYGDDPYSGSFGNSRWGSPIPPYADVYGRPWRQTRPSDER